MAQNQGRKQAKATKRNRPRIIVNAGIERIMNGNDDEAELLSRVAFERMREDIISGALEPGQPLRLSHLKERYGIGFSPLREALNQLRVEQLVTSSSNRGFRVSTISLEQMWDTIRTRVLIEGEAFASAIAHGDDGWESNIVKSFYSLDKIRTRESNSPENSESMAALTELRHREFHKSLIAACDSDLLLHLSNNLYMLTERYRRPLLAQNLHAADGSRDPHNEHRALMDAALDRDINAARSMLESHLTNTGKFIEKMLALPTRDIAEAAS